MPHWFLINATTDLPVLCEPLSLKYWHLQFSAILTDPPFKISLPNNRFLFFKISTAKSQKVLYSPLPLISSSIDDRQSLYPLAQGPCLQHASNFPVYLVCLSVFHQIFYLCKSQSKEHHHEIPTTANTPHMQWDKTHFEVLGCTHSMYTCAFQSTVHLD